VARPAARRETARELGARCEELVERLLPRHHLLARQEPRNHADAVALEVGGETVEVGGGGRGHPRRRPSS
jgi:hypothetical protein